MTRRLVLASLLAACAHAPHLPLDEPTRVVQLCTALEHPSSTAWLECLAAAGESTDATALVRSCRTYGHSREDRELCMRLFADVPLPVEPLVALCKRADSEHASDGCLYELASAQQPQDVAATCSTAADIEACTRQLAFARDPQRVAALCKQAPATLLEPERCLFDLSQAFDPDALLATCARERTRDAQAACFEGGARAVALTQAVERCHAIVPSDADQAGCLAEMFNVSPPLIASVTGRCEWHPKGYHPLCIRTANQGPLGERLESPKYPPDGRRPLGARRSHPEDPRAACAAALPGDESCVDLCVKTMTGGTIGWPDVNSWGWPYTALNGWGREPPGPPGGGWGFR